MKRIVALTVFAMLCLMSCKNTEKCLQKYGYENCEHLKQAFHLQDKDEAIRYHVIKKECGCKD
jgi:hypothetical protein